MNIYFDKSLKRHFLTSQKLITNESGYIVDQETGERVRDENKKLIKTKDFAGIRKGSRIFLSADITTVIEEASLEAKRS